jgi:hypothetical protein
MQFAASVASGKALVTAYREAYKPANDRAPSVYQNAKRAAKHPQIAERIQQLQLQLLPGPDDIRKIRGHALAVAIQLSVSSEDDRVRLKSAAWLYAEAGRLETLEAARPRDQREEIISELRDLYHKALGPRDSSMELVVEEVRNAAAAEEAEGALVGDVEPPEESSVQEEVSRETPPVAEDDVAQPGTTTAPAPRRYIMERTTPPGFFPAKFKKVPVP